MDFKQILENKPLLYGIIGVIVVVISIIIMVVIINAGNGATSAEKAKLVSEKPIQEDLTLLTTDNIGKAIEIQLQEH